MINPTQLSRQYGKEQTLGALYLVDHAPERPDGTPWRKFSEQLIEGHLKRHSYYRISYGKRELVDGSKMRAHIRELCRSRIKPGTPKPHGEFKDNVDILFGCGGSGILDQDFLRRSGYDKATFLESQLNKHVSEEAVSTTENTEKETKHGVVHDETERDEDNHNGVAEEHCSSEAGAEVHADNAVSIPTQPALPLLAIHRGPPTRTPQAHCHRLTRSLALQGIRETEPPFTGNNAEQANEPDVSGAVKIPAKRKRAATESIGDCSLSSKQPIHAVGADKSKSLAQDNTPQVNLDERTRGPTIAKQSGRPHKAPHVQLADKDSDLLRSAILSAKEQRRPSLTELNVDEQGRDFNELSRDLKVAVNNILESIGNMRNEQSPLNSDPPEPLRVLYVRCWGSHWKIVRGCLREKSVFTTPRVLMSLLARFLHDNVLIQEASRQDIRKSCQGLRGTSSKAMIELLDENAILEKARNIATDEACAMLAQDDKALQQGLQAKSETLLKDLSTTMTSHLQALQSQAKLQGLEPGKDLQEVFDSELAKIIQKALHYRLRLLATGCDYAYTWPRPETSFEPRDMQIDGGQAGMVTDRRRVLFTVFPGLKVKLPEADEMETLLGTKALVRAELIEDGLDTSNDE